MVEETLRRTCAAVRVGPLRVLDVGGGDGADALTLVQAGHHVTIIDFSVPLLQAASEDAAARGVAQRLRTVSANLDDLPSLGLGSFDVVLCHNVVQYRDSTVSTVRLLADAVGAGGALSLIAPNPASEVLAAIIRREDLRGAAELLSAEQIRSETFERDVRRVTPEEAESTLRVCGFTDLIRFGIRTITDYIANDALKYEQDFYRGLEQLELTLCDREPFIRTARMWQLVGRR